MAETGLLHSTPVSRTQDPADSAVGTTQKSSQHAYDKLTHILQTPLENTFFRRRWGKTKETNKL